MNIRQTNLGIFTGFFTFIFWGSLVLYWKALAHINAVEILLHRMCWSLVTIAILATICNSFADIWVAVKQRALMLRIFMASIFIAGNWLLYIWSVTSGYIVEASLGSFINPLIFVLLGYIFLGEKMTHLQIIAIIIASLGVLYSVVTYGEFPFIGLTLASTFGVYGYIKKNIQLAVVPVFFLESLLLFPVAFIALLWLNITGEANFFAYDLKTQALLVGTGLVTAFPLLLFAYTSKNVQLATLGLMQYISPSLNLLLGVFVFHESISSANQIMLICIWIALAIYTWCSIRQYKAVKTKFTN